MAEKKWCYIDVHPDLKAKIDVEDLERVQQHSWRVTKGSRGRLRVVTSIYGPKGSRQVTLGRFLMNPPAGQQVYPRRFNDGLDYRKSNLIVCTVKERQRLLPKKRIETSSPYRGVAFSSREGKWRATIQKEGRTYNLGRFQTPEDAALAYNKAARELFGESAYQNPIGRKKSERNEE